MTEPSAAAASVASPQDACAGDAIAAGTTVARPSRPQPSAIPLTTAATGAVAETASSAGLIHPESGARAILYSFRRCPYAIRARLALAAAGIRPGADLELREVALKAKPPELLAASAKGTVPVLVLPAVRTRADGDAAGSAVPAQHGQMHVCDESLAIMRWALDQGDPHGWSQGWSRVEQQRIEALLDENDGPFKQHLDRFKYAGRHGEAGLQVRQEHRREGLVILRDWDQRLRAGGWLLGGRPSLADMALLPFVRQFRLADPQAFDAEPGLDALQAWLVRFQEGRELAAVMEPPWALRSAWRSPGWLYHLALRQDWQAACSQGDYRVSTRGRSLQEVGFVHLSQAHQLEATAARFYSDVPAGDLLLLVVDPERLQAAGLEVRLEPAPGSTERFPHLYGPLPLAAVRLAERFLRSEASVAPEPVPTAGALAP